MIELHRIGIAGRALLVNPDLILTVEETPDTVIKMTTGAHLVVAEAAGDVVDAMRTWRAGVLNMSHSVSSVH
ncbi:MAG TPA: flagellar FlbD family protein [Solirubrobacteraceae bacterium]|nr:flagellar FlbD family protein [Solirubrobacteraceae bacterium]